MSRISRGLARHLDSGWCGGLAHLVGGDLEERVTCRGEGRSVDGGGATNQQEYRQASLRGRGGGRSSTPIHITKFKDRLEARPKKIAIRLSRL